nr:FtsQ-type POTRA domain-containing protein [Micromonospora sp. DSM 115978]
MVRAGRDAVPPSARRFMRRARRRKLRAAAPWAVAGGTLLVGLLAAWLVMGTGLFGVREVRITGAELVSPVDVRGAAAVADDTPLARVDVDAVRDRVAALAPVARVTVTRQWPDTLRIDLVERSAVAVVPQGRGFAVVDANGVVFRTLPRRPPELPIAVVAEPGPDDVATRAALQVLAALTPKLRAELTEVAVEGPARIRVKLRGDRVVIWGDASRSETKAQVATGLLGQRGDTIDVSAPDVVTIR